MNLHGIKSGLRVRVSQLESTIGMNIVPKHLECRKAGITGEVKYLVPGHGGDVWFVQHDGSTDVGAYSYTELEPCDATVPLASRG